MPKIVNTPPMPSEFHNREPPLPFGNPKSRPWYGMDILWNRPIGIKDGFEEMEHEFLFGIFHLEKQDYLFTCSFAPRNFPLEQPKKVVFHLLSNQIF